MKYFIGPFIGEFGWELCYWHSWIRAVTEKIKKYDESAYFSTISYPGRYPLYESVDKFYDLPNFFLNQNFSQRNYFLETNNNQLHKKIRETISQLMDHVENLNSSETIYIYNYPQKIHSNNIFLKAINKLRKQNKSQIVNMSSSKDLEKFNYHAGLRIKDPLFLNHPYKYNNYIPQIPDNDQQSWIKLNPSIKGKEASSNMMKGYDKKRKIFTVFPRARFETRPDKNWEKSKWIEFFDLLIKKYDPIIVICGSKNGAYFAEIENDHNFINLLNVEPKLALDLQLAFLNLSEIAIHGRSGSCNLSLQTKTLTFMAGPEEDRIRICEDDNAMKSSIKYYTEYGINPPVEKFYGEFVKYYEKNCQKYI